MMLLQRLLMPFQFKAACRSFLRQEDGLAKAGTIWVVNQGEHALLRICEADLHHSAAIQHSAPHLPQGELWSTLL